MSIFHSSFFVFFAAATAIAVLRTTRTMTTARSLTGGELICVLVAATKSEYSFFFGVFFSSFGGIWCCGSRSYILEKFSRETRVCRRSVMWW